MACYQFACGILTKNPKKPKNGVRDAAEGSNFVFKKNKVCQPS
jgi:hypothetical protein